MSARLNVPFAGFYNTSTKQWNAPPQMTRLPDKNSTLDA
jgi:hypothetical protein